MEYVQHLANANASLDGAVIGVALPPAMGGLPQTEPVMGMGNAYLPICVNATNHGVVTNAISQSALESQTGPVPATGMVRAFNRIFVSVIAGLQAKSARSLPGELVMYAGRISKIWRLR